MRVHGKMNDPRPGTRVMHTTLLFCYRPVHTRDPINPAVSRSGKMDGSAMSGPRSGRAYVGLKYSGDWSGPL